jgi:hypothetical protein
MLSLTMLGGIGDYSTIRQGMYQSTLPVIGCRLINEVALSACRCRVQICNRHCRIIDEINITTFSVCRNQLQVCDTNEEALFYYVEAS